MFDAEFLNKIWPCSFQFNYYHPKWLLFVFAAIVLQSLTKKIILGDPVIDPSVGS